MTKLNFQRNINFIPNL